MNVALPSLETWESYARSGRDPAELLDIDPEDVLRALLPPRPAWMAEAACRGMSPGIFFPSKGASPHPARTVCARCPVSDPCARYALEEGLFEYLRLAFRSEGPCVDPAGRVAKPDVVSNGTVRDAASVNAHAARSSLAR